jgi:hypothetical protein
MPVTPWAQAPSLACAALLGLAATGICRAQPPLAPPTTLADEPLAALQQQVTALRGRVDELDNLTLAMRTLAARVDRIDRMEQLQRKWTALQDGRPLGRIADAPPALARFADAPPPTLASLRASFPAAARAARRASEGPANGGFLARMWSRVAALVTVREGDHVLVGTPAAAILATARAELDQDDLGAALSTLDRLDPAARLAMADWIASARALLDARAALAAAER